MYVCDNCFEEFEEPKVIVTDSDLDTTTLNEVDVCPHCSSECFEKI